jgi:UDP-N-acetylglucosamine 4,6-dehydratase/5-epimerase
MDKKINSNTNLKNLLKCKTILITGGGGSICSVLVKKILEFPIHSIRVLDVDEHSLFKLKRSVDDKRLRLFLGSINDIERVDRACQGADIIIHAAAVKNVDVTEFNPFETIETNIQGTMNMIKSAMKHNPEKFVNISTDKAVNPSTLYGSTKQIGEKLIHWASDHINSTKFSTIRFGNVIETRGNIFELWTEQAKNNIPLHITDPKMKRYFFHVDEAVDFILQCITISKGGEIFVPKMKLFNIMEFANKFSKNHKIIGIRQGEKLSEVLLTDSEKKSSVEKNNMWIIKP